MVDVGIVIVGELNVSSVSRLGGTEAPGVSNVGDASGLEMVAPGTGIDTDGTVSGVEGRPLDRESIVTDSTTEFCKDDGRLVLIESGLETE